MENRKKLKILMLEDNRDDVGLIERVLRKDNMDFVTQRVDTREEFNTAIKSFAPDVVLSDHGLPEFNSIEALKICLKQNSFAPFILVTGTVSEEFAATCLKLGADDYILKSNLSRLPSAILRALKERKLVHLKREARRALRKQNEALLHANDELFKVNHELDRFVYSVSHNLRSPLASVLGLLNIAKEENPSASLASIHEMMRKSIEHLDDRLKDIITYSQNARNEVETEIVNVEELCHYTIEKLRYLDPDSQVTWMVNTDNHSAFIRTDKIRLSVILNNLLTNALQYRDEHKSPIISIDVTTLNNAFSIVIKDNGIGIDEAVKSKVFDMFYRGTQRSNGAGLGLYIVKEIVKRLNGTVTLECQDKQWTTVTVSIATSRFTPSLET
jgi:signal transduction histidine kinase